MMGRAGDVGGTAGVSFVRGDVVLAVVHTVANLRNRTHEKVKFILGRLSLDLIH